MHSDSLLMNAPVRIFTSNGDVEARVAGTFEGGMNIYFDSHGETAEEHPDWPYEIWDWENEPFPKNLCVVRMEDLVFRDNQNIHYRASQCKFEFTKNSARMEEFLSAGIRRIVKKAKAEARQ